MRSLLLTVVLGCGVFAGVAWYLDLPPFSQKTEGTTQESPGTQEARALAELGPALYKPAPQAAPPAVPMGMAQYKDPIVIEGYWDGGVPADQLRLSRTRAMIVRQYLQDHYQLDPRYIGVVSLKNAPPKGVEHAKWDGVCIVVLRRG